MFSDSVDAELEDVEDELLLVEVDNDVAVDVLDAEVVDSEAAEVEVVAVSVEELAAAVVVVIEDTAEEIEEEAFSLLLIDPDTQSPKSLG